MKNKFLTLLSILFCISLVGCSSSGTKEEDNPPITPPPPTPVTDPYIKIIPLNDKTPYTGFVNGNNNTKYKVELTNKYGQKSYYNWDYYIISWESSDRDVVNPSLEKWFVSNGKATITCTYHDYYDNYTDTMEVTSVTRVIEEKTNYSHMLYEVNKTYDLPDQYLPVTSSLYYEISDPNVIRVDESTRQIECLSPGVSELKVSYYGENYNLGELSSKTYVIDVIDESAPKFYLNDEVCSEGILTAAKNKYVEINPSDLGLKAFDKDNNDISSSITLVEGEYNTRELGEYPLTYKVVDSNGLYSYFFATLKIVNRDYTKTRIEESGLSTNNDILVANVSSSVVKQSGVVFLNKVNYQVNINITDLYDEIDASVTVTVKFKIEDWSTTAHTVRNSSIDIIGYLSYKTSGSFSASYTPENRNLNGNTYQETGKTVRITGYGYNYIYYD